MMNNLKYGDKLFSDDIEKYKNDIIKWCNNNYISHHVILKYLNVMGSYGLRRIDVEENKIFKKFADKFRTNYVNYLSTSSIHERIIRSFIYGRPCNFAYKLKPTTTLVTMINLKYYNVDLKKSFPTKFPETMTHLSNSLVFFINYDEPPLSKIGQPHEEQFIISIVSEIEPSWLIPACQLLINPYNLNNYVNEHSEGNNDFYVIMRDNELNYQMIRRNIINSWNTGFNIWASEDTPILSHFYKMITKTISQLNMY